MVAVVLLLLPMLLLFLLLLPLLLLMLGLLLVPIHEPKALTFCTRGMSSGWQPSHALAPTNSDARQPSRGHMLGDT